MRTPAGDAGWRVTGHAEVRRLLTDPRLGRSHPEPDAAAWYSRTDLSGRPTGNSAAEHEEHARWRRVVTRVFPPRRLERLRPRIEGLAGDLLDRLSAEGPEADFHAAISAVLPTLVICELLGVPLSDAGRFRRWTEEGAINTDIARSAKGMAELLLYVQELIRRRRLEPGDDVVSELLAAENEAPRAYERRVAKLLAGILAFGRETPGNAIDRGVLLLLSHAAQREALCRQPELAAGAVDEVLRCFPPSAATGGGLVRYAHADVDVGGALIG